MVNSISKTVTLENLDTFISSNLLNLAQAPVVFLLFGQLGAGKTTLVKKLIKQLGINDEITSPTFGYVNTYTNHKENLTIHHFDLYRFSTIDEFLMQGFDEYLEQKNAISIIEWPEIIQDFMQKKATTSTRTFCITLKHNFTHPETRDLTVSTIQFFTKIK